MANHSDSCGTSTLSPDFQEEGRRNETKAMLGYGKVPYQTKKICPAWEFHAGTLCWFINGTICEGIVHKNCKEKMNLCSSCEVWDAFFGIYRELNGRSDVDQ